MKNILIVGAGFSGAILARELAERANCSTLVLDVRDHIAGNCHTYRDPISNVMIHKYGPHIFHTKNQRVWEYINRFTTFGPYTHRVKAITAQGVFSLPVNLLTINQFFNKILNPNEAYNLLQKLGDKSIHEPRNFEEQALKFVGPELYQTFFYGYTKKQWGCEPSELPASLLKRLPIRFNYDDNYFFDPHQGIPVDGYSAIIEKILAHPKITVQLNTKFTHDMPANYDHVFYSGTIDGFFDYRLGRIGYRTVTFERIDTKGDFQGSAQINYTNLNVPFTRIHEHKHFTPWEAHEKTVAFREFSKETEPDDIPYYPKNLQVDQTLYQRYCELAKTQPKITFVGRLGTYRYLDMDTTIAEALTVADEFIQRHKT
ncbi:MAG: UDP-galactopyranose mutase [Verrucomicrobiales bacterium]|jgi:UDP-galactopyranose mutase|nr:UDP-galactopyranose mutase [Verrucomicrobiales bacterium]